MCRWHDLGSSVCSVLGVSDHEPYGGNSGQKCYSDLYNRQTGISQLYLTACACSALLTVPDVLHITRYSDSDITNLNHWAALYPIIKHTNETGSNVISLEIKFAIVIQR